MKLGPSSDATDDPCAQAWALQQAGLLAEAKSECRAILARDPKNSGCLHLRGVIAYQTGRNHAAEELVRKAIALDPGAPTYHNTLGVVLTAQGRHRYRARSVSL